MFTHFFKKRLVEDFRLPIKILEEPYFSYYVDLYRKEFELDKKINVLEKSIEMAGGEEELKKLWYKVKDDVEAKIKALPEYEQFLNYTPTYKLQSVLQNGHPYNHGSLDKTCVSIDIKTANYNALRHFNQKLVFDTTTFSEFIKMHSAVPLFEESKIFRQLLFEPINAKRQGLVQRSIINQTADELIPVLNPVMGRSVSNDELILVFNKTEDVNELESKVKKALESSTHKNLLKVEAFNVVHLYEDNFYKKTKDGFVLRNASSQIYPQLFKKAKGLPFDERDLLFWDTNTKMLAKYVEPIFKDDK